MRARLVARLAWRDWRSGELNLLVLALVVAITSVTAVAMLVDRLQQALLSESADFIAADRYIGGSQPLPDSFRAAAAARGIDHVDVLAFPSMIFGPDDRSQLASIKAVGAGYPLRGQLEAAAQPFAPGEVVADLPAPGEVWLDARLFPALGIAPGDVIEVGMAKLRVSRVLVAEPDRGGSLFDLGPRLLMRVEDVPRTGVVQPGSRISYRLLLRGPTAALDDLVAEVAPAPTWRVVDVRSASPAIGAALDRAEQFLLLGGLLGVLLAGVAVALSAHRYAARHFDHVAILKTLGAAPGSILRGFLLLLALVGGVAVAIGLLAATGVHLAMISVLQTLVPVDLPPPTVRPYLLGAATGFICALSFALPPLLALYRISPMRVIRRDLGPAPLARWVSYAAGGAGALGLLIWYTGSLTLTLWTLAGTAAVLLVFGLLALVLLRGGRLVGMQAGSGWRLALAGLQRRRQENVAQILIFGLALMLLLVLVLLRTALLDQWRGQLPADAPNHFVMNITPAQVDPVGDLLGRNTQWNGEIFPMIRGRMVAIDGVAIADWQARRAAADATAGEGGRGSDAGEDGAAPDAERNLTWREDVPPDNRVVLGDWWTADETRALVSVETGYAERIGLQLGNVLRFDIAGRVVEAEVANLREVDWQSMHPNFFIVFSPGVLDDQPTTWLTSFRLEAGDKTFLNTLLGSFPTLTVIEIDAVIDQIRQIIARVTQAVELVLGLVLTAGCLVLVASIQAGRDARLMEHALLRALGANRRLIVLSLAVEFAALGLFAGIIAVIGAEISAAILQRQVFNLPFALHPALWLWGPLAGMGLVLVVGMFGARQLVSSAPMRVLRGT